MSCDVASLKRLIKNLNIEEDIVRISEEICKYVHAGQLDKANKPYYLHPRNVALKCSSPITKSVAWLHDVLEDTSITSNILRELGIPNQIINSVELLTKEKGTPYMEYINFISLDPIASEVKFYDLKHNSDLSRTGGQLLVSDKNTVFI